MNSVASRTLCGEGYKHCGWNNCTFNYRGQCTKPETDEPIPCFGDK